MSMNQFAKSKEKERDQLRPGHLLGYLDKKTTALLMFMGVMCFVVLLLQAIYSGTSYPCTLSLISTSTKMSSSSSPSSSFHDYLKAALLHDISTDHSKSQETHGARGQIYSNERRHLVPYGLAAYLFVHMGTYRGGAGTFATVGLASKPLHVFGKPYFICEWIPAAADPKRSSSRSVATAKGQIILPDWGYGRIYTVVVVNCTFAEDVGSDAKGGELVVHAHHGDDDFYGKPASIRALKESPGQYNASVFNPPYPYDYLYCGSSLYGPISPQRMREWMAYHAKIFGPRAHFVLHDAGGISEEVRRVLEPWVRNGRVTIQDFREQARYDGYYYNQFLVVNDCLHRYRFMADWTFFFDVDEYIYTPPGTSLGDALKTVSGYTQFTFEQMPMSNKLCLATDETNMTSLSNPSSTHWGFEKLVFRNVKRGGRLDRKYAIKARNALATGVHMSENIVGKTTHSKARNNIKYYHYHDTISFKGELCRQFLNPKNKTVVWSDNIPYKYDGSMVPLAAAAKEFELQQLGSQPVVS